MADRRDVLIVDRLDNRPRWAGVKILSCGQHPRAFDGMLVGRIFATDEAVNHQHFDRIAQTLLRSASKG